MRDEAPGFLRAHSALETLCLERDDFFPNRHLALTYSWSMILSDLPSPAEASSHTTDRAKASRRRETGIHP
jgi:hypothetical protein